MQYDKTEQMIGSLHMKVLILEPHSDGHHGAYLHWMAAGLVDRGFEVTIITLPETLVHPSMQALTGTALTDGAGSLRLIGAATPITLPSGATGGAAGLSAREWAYWRLFRAWYVAHAGSVRPDVVYLPYLDYCLYAIGLLGSPFDDCPWVGLAMRPSFHYQEMGVMAPKPSLARLKRRLFFRLLKQSQLIRLLSVDEPLVDYASKVSDKAKWKVTLFPEPVDLGPLPAKIESKRRLELNVEHLTVLLYGALTARKGVSVLLRAAASREFPANVDVLLAGRVSDEDTRKLLSLPWVGELVAQDRLKIIDRFISAAEEPALFSAADIVWLGYQGHYSSSGVLCQAASTKRPVIATNEGLIGWQTSRHGLGRTVDVSKVEDVVGALIGLTEKSFAELVNQDSSRWTPPGISEVQASLADILLVSTKSGYGAKVI